MTQISAPKCNPGPPICMQTRMCIDDLHSAACWAIGYLGGQNCSNFFSSGTADVALRLGPKIGVNVSNELKSRNETQGFHDKIARANPKNKQEKQTKTTEDPQIPQPDLRFASGSKSKQHKTGPGPTPNNTKDLPRHRGNFPPCHKNMHKSKLIKYIHQRHRRHSKIENARIASIPVLMLSNCESVHRSGAPSV